MNYLVFNLYNSLEFFSDRIVKKSPDKLHLSQFVVDKDNKLNLMERRAKMTDGERMRRRREDKEMSLRELAERTLLDYAFLSRVENNLRTLTLQQAKVVARELGCTLDELVG